MTDELERDVAEVKAQLDRIVRLLALLVVSPEQSLAEKALALSAAGLSSREIAAVVGATPHTVSQTLSHAKKTKKKAVKKSAKRI